MDQIDLLVKISLDLATGSSALDRSRRLLETLRRVIPFDAATVIIPASMLVHDAHACLRRCQVNRQASIWTTGRFERRVDISARFGRAIGA